QFFAPKLKAVASDRTLDFDPRKIMRRHFGNFDDAFGMPRGKLNGQLGAIAITGKGGEIFIDLGFENVDPHSSALTFSWTGGRVRLISACRWRRGPASCAGPRPSRQKLLSCERVSGTDGQPRLFRGQSAPTAFRKSVGASFLEKRLPAASSFSKHGELARHCYPGRKLAI